MDIGHPPIKHSRLSPILSPIRAFLAAESAGGVVLIVATVIALAWANSPWSHSYHALWDAKVGMGIGGEIHAMTLHHFVNDALMAVFFLLVGLEIKRALLFGELASVRRASLPVAAAVGGMVVPALIYALFNMRGDGAHGWGIPMATDIAFAVGVVALVGRSLPTSAKVFLLAVAIVDDLGAVVVIAIFYTQKIAIGPLALAGAFLIGLIMLNALRVHNPWPYVFVGIGLWVFTLASGVHATVAGVLMALTIPATRQIAEMPYVEHMRLAIEEFAKDAAVVPDKITEEQSHALHSMAVASRAVQTPLARVEHALLKPVNFVIVPLFALANAGIDLRGTLGKNVLDPTTWGVFLGLLLGKPIGILLASWLAVCGGVASLPQRTSWRQLVGLSILCGIGFTMSIFVANLAFGVREDLLTDAKMGILAASLVSGLVGGLVIAKARGGNAAENGGIG